MWLIIIKEVGLHVGLNICYVVRLKEEISTTIYTSICGNVSSDNGGLNRNKVMYLTKTELHI